MTFPPCCNLYSSNFQISLTLKFEMSELELVILGSVILGFHEFYSNVPTHETLTNLQALNSLSKCKHVMFKAITLQGVLTSVVFALLQSKEVSKPCTPLLKLQGICAFQFIVLCFYFQCPMWEGTCSFFLLHIFVTTILCFFLEVGFLQQIQYKSKFMKMYPYIKDVQTEHNLKAPKFYLTLHIFI